MTGPAARLGPPGTTTERLLTLERHLREFTRTHAALLRALDQERPAHAHQLRDALHSHATAVAQLDLHLTRAQFVGPPQD
ncbi:hypothetical protein GCM10008959_26160 [Deinococcus seoulensis]|uniref:DUF892 family protein n=1 Tax=Deinococcus seoulensis TaxID=1837379 RepID=A0ABQ2RW59_9DEIO|nr:hypothetical protein [Deinococcus seoulensis]GGR62875.1 hypothetical protein GCM10008959_26160 [Deinococcus seoulensis]